MCYFFYLFSSSVSIAHSDFDHPKHDYDKLPQPKPIHPSFCSPGISSDEDPYMVLVSSELSWSLGKFLTYKFN